MWNKFVPTFRREIYARGCTQWFIQVVWRVKRKALPLSFSSNFPDKAGNTNDRRATIAYNLLNVEAWRGTRISRECANPWPWEYRREFVQYLFERRAEDGPYIQPTPVPRSSRVDFKRISNSKGMLARYSIFSLLDDFILFYFCPSTSSWLTTLLNFRFVKKVGCILKEHV